jgi:hypothetical protein
METPEFRIGSARFFHANAQRSVKLNIEQPFQTSRRDEIAVMLAVSALKESQRVVF